MARYIYQLTDDDLALCDHLAGRRQRSKEDHNVRTKKETDHHTDLDLHYMSLCAQVAVGHFLRLPIDKRILPRGNKSGYDFTFPWGHTVDVMYRKKYFWDLMLRSLNIDEFRADITVLVWPALPGNGAYAYEMAGWSSRQWFRDHWEEMKLPKGDGEFYAPKAGLSYMNLRYFGNLLRYCEVMRGEVPRAYVPDGRSRLADVRSR